MHKGSLSETLLTNSQISGVRLENYDRNLSSKAHGLYIQSLSDDCYADLRLCSEKPFWGHTHPLEVQDHFGQLKYDEKGPQLHVYQLSDIQTFLADKTVQFVDELEAANSWPSLDKEFIYGMNTLLTQNSLFPPQILPSQNFFLEIQPYPYVISQKKLEGLQGLDSAFIQKLFLYMDFLIWKESGKQIRDQKTIAQNISQKIKQFGNYLYIQGKVEKGIIKKCLNSGLFISEGNLTETGLYLCLPLSCTNDELLDTLERINKVAEEL
ncbi:MAG: hypothetical protein CME62_16670 [Halobacteriovoraceae bacterium]|nr:hypothetical protein [Halobacteriovoraceae bacterium]|tara:strand:+ start:18759 stop:19559 length:801 start_codon:yes stop_codon:yes gene_type:complete